MLARLLSSFLVVVILAALLAPCLAPCDPEQLDLAHIEQAPGPGHPLGTDRLGRDLLSRLLYGARNSLGVAALAAVLGCALGLVVGVLAGSGSKWLDDLLMRLVDLGLALPAFFLLVGVQAIVPPRALTVALVIAATRWMPLARLVRGQFLSLREQEFVLAARATGCSPARIAARHLLPNALAPVLVFFSLALADALLLESALSFLGLGLPAGQPSWGAILADGRASILGGAWWAVLFPGLAILAVTAAVNLLGDELQHRTLIQAGRPTYPFE